MPIYTHHNHSSERGIALYTHKYTSRMTLKGAGTVYHSLSVKDHVDRCMVLVIHLGYTSRSSVRDWAVSSTSVRKESFRLSLIQRKTVPPPLRLNIETALCQRDLFENRPMNSIRSTEYSD